MTLATKSTLAIMLAALVGLTACGDDGGTSPDGGDGGDEGMEGMATVRVLHGIEGGPSVNIGLDGEDEALIAELAPESFSDTISIPAGEELLIDLTSVEDDSVIVDDFAVTAEEGKSYLIVAHPDNEDAAVTLFEEDFGDTIEEGNARVRVAHAAPQLGDVDVFFTPEGEDKADEAAIPALAVGAIASADAPEGTYDVDVDFAVEGEDDSRQFAEVALADQDNVTAVAVLNGEDALLYVVPDTEEGAAVTPLEGAAL